MGRIITMLIAGGGGGKFCPRAVRVECGLASGRFYLRCRVAAARGAAFICGSGRPYRGRTQSLNGV